MQRLKTPRILLSGIMLLGLMQTVSAKEGEPLAVRRWPGGTVSVETHWGLRLVIDGTDESAALVGKPVDASLSSSVTHNHVLSRQPNASKSALDLMRPPKRYDANAVTIESVRVKDHSGIQIKVDGATLLFVSDRKPESSWPSFSDRADLLIVNEAAATKLAKLREATDAQGILLNFEPNADAIKGLVKSAGNTAQAVTVAHNTVAVSHAHKPAQPKLRVFSTTTKPWEMPDDLGKLFAAMEKACAESQKVFGKLSVTQLNFKPSNGTHTPRWNTEHMMGRQLVFFSQIYHKIDPTIPVMDLNPKQMPPDYVFAHPDWDGKEEARQMQRVSDFTRRFAYLLDGLDVSKRAPGSRWPSLRALLRQMDRHYSEHTANTVKKFDLPDFPKK